MMFVRKTVNGEAGRLERIQIKDLVDPVYGPREAGLKDVRRLETLSFNFDTRTAELVPITAIGRYPWEAKMLKITLPLPYKSVTLTLNHTVFIITPEGVFPVHCDRLTKNQAILVADGVEGVGEELKNVHIGAAAIKQMMFTKKTNLIYDIVTKHENIILGNSVIVSSS